MKEIGKFGVSFSGSSVSSVTAFGIHTNEKKILHFIKE